MNLRASIIALLLAPALLLVSGRTWAITCTYETESGMGDDGHPYMPNPYGSRMHNITFDLGNHAITVGRDVAPGQVVFRKRLQIDSSDNFRLVCSAGKGYVWSNRRLVDLVFPSSPWNSGPYAGKIYETGLAGIGVAIVQSMTDKPLPNESGRSPQGQTGSSCSATKKCHWRWLSAGQAVDVVLIKTGEVASGTIAGANLPAVQNDFLADGVFQLPLLKITLSGRVIVVAATCAASDVPVDLGRHTVKDLSESQATGWRPFAIELRDCPGFHGTYPQAGGLLYSETGKPVPAVAPQVNAVKFAIRPRTAVIDAGRGLMGLLASGIDGDAPAATGVAVQVAMDDAASTPVVLGGVLNPSQLDLRPTASQSLPIRLKARYYRHAPQATAGSGDAIAEFTIDYQ